MQHWTALLGITAAIGIGAASPGPSFVMVARTAASQGRPHGLLAAAGIGVGGLIFAILALLGLHSLLNLAPTLYLALKLAGGLYLAWLGWRIWRGARQALALPAAASPHSQHRAFAAGLATQLSNPKTAIVYTSVFAAFLPEQPELSFKILTALAVLLVETGWLHPGRLGTLRPTAAPSLPAQQNLGRPRCRRGDDGAWAETGVGSGGISAAQNHT